MPVAKVTESDSTSIESCEGVPHRGMARRKPSMRHPHLAAVVAAAIGLTVATAGCENNSGTAQPQPTPRVSPVAAPGPPPVVSLLLARGAP